MNGVISVPVYAAVTAFIISPLMKKTISLKGSNQEQPDGLSMHEYGMNLYSDFHIGKSRSQAFSTYCQDG
ncbi:MAG: ammonium transporter [Lacrimispora celerecrescens]|nr:ammonium transporter [Lacrimispora celerecrescens]